MLNVQLRSVGFIVESFDGSKVVDVSINIVSNVLWPPYLLVPPCVLTQTLNEIFKVSNIEIAEISNLLIGAVQCCIELDSRSISNTLRLVINSAA